MAETGFGSRQPDIRVYALIHGARLPLQIGKGPEDTEAQREVTCMSLSLPFSQNPSSSYILD